MRVPIHDTEAFLDASLRALEAFALQEREAGVVDRMAALVAASIAAGGKLMVAGNGGSAADAQHIATEFVSRLVDDRAPYAAIALTTDSSVLTACGNDYGFDQVFARQVAGHARPGDVFLAISTSGNSPNVLRALEAARHAGIATLGFTGPGGGKMDALCDVLLTAPHPMTAIIQQIHITAAHLLVAKAERLLQDK